MLGLTMECARCHDHKFDPITQRDYYGLFAFFNSIDESGLYSHFTERDAVAVAAAVVRRQRGTASAADTRIAAREAQTARDVACGRTAFDAQAKRRAWSRRRRSRIWRSTPDGDKTPDSVLVARGAVAGCAGSSAVPGRTRAVR